MANGIWDTTDGCRHYWCANVLRLQHNAGEALGFGRKNKDVRLSKATHCLGMTE